MAKALASTALFLALNLLFFTLVSSNSAPCPPSSPSKSQKHHHKHCPRDALKFSVCSDVLNGLAGVVYGTPPKTPCCSLLNGLIDLEASVCLCTAIKANILGINLNLPVSLSLVLDFCGKKTPSSFQCA